jgi:DNA polymerase-3 subunit delta'
MDSEGSSASADFRRRGKTDSAGVSPRSFNAVNGSDAVGGGDIPCDACSSCVKIDKNTHPDVKLVACGGRAGDIVVEQIRALIKDITLKPYEGRHKVFIVEEAHLMNAAAANSFLKTLEEPPPDSVLILITERPSDLEPTIASRCQIIRVRPMKTDVLAGILAEEYGLAAEKAKCLARICDGRIGKALSRGGEILAARDEALEKFSDDGFIERLASGDKDALIGELSILAGWYRDILVYKATEDADFIVNFDRISDIKREEKLRRSDELLKMFEDVVTAQERLKNNVNPKIVMAGIFG